MLDAVLRFVKGVPRARWVVGALVFLVILAAGRQLALSQLARSCEVEAVKEATAVLVSLTDRFDDVYSSAANGTPTSLEYPISVMQQTLMDTQQVELPACMENVRYELVGYMDAVIRAFRAYAADEPNANVEANLENSYSHIKDATQELDRIEQCAPYCLPLSTGAWSKP